MYEPYEVWSQPEPSAPQWLSDDVGLPEEAGPGSTPTIGGSLGTYGTQLVDAEVPDSPIRRLVSVVRSRLVRTGSEHAAAEFIAESERDAA